MFCLKNDRKEQIFIEPKALNCSFYVINSPKAKYISSDVTETSSRNQQMFLLDKFIRASKLYIGLVSLEKYDAGNNTGTVKVRVLHLIPVM